VGLHLLRGLLELAQGDTGAALQELTREIASGERALIYTAQARANAWCAMGALHLRRGEAGAARQAFDRAIEAVPGHPAALAAGAFITSKSADTASFEHRVQQLREAGAPLDAAFAEATLDALHGRHDRAASRLHVVLERQSSGSGGWTIPVDPLLHVGAHPDAWKPVLALLRSRAA
jgi:thioredoxin-like negative regulator of GroEL